MCPFERSFTICLNKKGPYCYQYGPLRNGLKAYKFGLVLISFTGIENR